MRYRLAVAGACVWLRSFERVFVFVFLATNPAGEKVNKRGDCGRRGDCGELFSFCCKGVAVFFLRGVFLEEPGIIRADVRMPETKCGDVAFIAEVSMVEMLLRYLEGTEPFSLE